MRELWHGSPDLCFRCAFLSPPGMLTATVHSQCIAESKRLSIRSLRLLDGQGDTTTGNEWSGTYHMPIFGTKRPSNEVWIDHAPSSCPAVLSHVWPARALNLGILRTPKRSAGSWV